MPPALLTGVGGPAGNRCPACKVHGEGCMRGWQGAWGQGPSRPQVLRAGRAALRWAGPQSHPFVAVVLFRGLVEKNGKRHSRGPRLAPALSTGYIEHRSRKQMLRKVKKKKSIARNISKQQNKKQNKQTKNTTLTLSSKRATPESSKGHGNSGSASPLKTWPPTTTVTASAQTP